MRQPTFSTVIYISTFIFAIIFVIILWSVDYKRVTNSCIMDIPHIVISGTIYNSPGGIFASDGPPRYIIYYKGKHKLTNKICRVGNYVTERRYEHLMYGDE